MSVLKKYLVVVLLALAFVMPIAAAPRPAQAFSPDVVAAYYAKWIWEKVKDIYKTAQESVSTDLWSRAFDMYMSNLAYSVANELATGGPGGKPQFRVQSIKDANKKAIDAAGGEFISELTKKGFDKLGLDLCDPSIEVKLTLTLSLIDAAAGPAQPKCTWTNVQKNWAKFGDTFQNDLIKFQLDPKGGQENIKAFWKGLSDESDSIAYLKLLSSLNDTKANQKYLESLKIDECMGFLDKQTTVTQEVKVHCSKIMNLSEKEWDTAVAGDTSKKEGAADVKTSNVKSFSKIMKDAANRFVNTFSSKLLKQWIKKGTWSLFGGDKETGNLRDNLITQLRGGADIRQPRDQDIFRDLKTTSLERVEDYSILNDFVLCPDDASVRMPDNCVIDSKLLEVINSNKTVREAIKDGSLDGSTVIISKDDVLRNNSDDCYKQGLCYRNLVKLRKANVVPLGWELAATRSSVTSPVTLQQAIDCFEDPPLGDCPFGPSDEYKVNGVPHNPFYHLIDGNWVLKAPKAMCEALVNANILQSPEAPERQQYCADYKTCLRQDDEGNCVSAQYSYCTKSENIWRFKGDICEDGEIYAGCLNFSNDEFGDASYIEGTLDYCDSNDAGCRRYSTLRRADGSWVLDNNLALDNNDIFLTNRSIECPESEAGCHEYIVMAADAGVNVVKNASFLNLDNDSSAAFPNGRPDGWVDENGNDTDALEYTASTGKIANDHTQTLQQYVILLPNTSYTLSASAAQYVAGGSAIAKVTIEMCDVGEPCDSAIFADAGPIDNIGTCDAWFIPTRPDEVNIIWQPGDNMTRKSCTFKTKDSSIGSARIMLSTSVSSGSWFDEIKLEVISDVSGDATAFSDYGVNGTINIGGDRVMCSEREVGCQGYKPANGDPMIPAVINQDDLCPSQCVGYATFTQQPNNFDLIEDPNATVQYQNFIPSTATQCPTNAIGCEEFTNLDAVAQGGEGREYFTYVRQCVLEFQGTSYYTWEGSDVEGYQLKTWLTLQDQISQGPCTNVQRGTSTCLDNTPGFPPAVCTAPDMATDPNCRLFYDEGGNEHYRLQDRIIFASNDCHDYRRTNSGATYRIIPNISTSCTAAQNNCRAYYGNTANNMRDVFSHNFENGTYSPWYNLTNTLSLSTESLQNNGHSLRVENNNGNTAFRPYTFTNKKKYQLSFWMKGDAAIGEVIPLFIGYDSNGVDHIVPLNYDSNNNIIETNFKNVEAGNWNYFVVNNYIDVGNVNIVDDPRNAFIFAFGASASAPVYFDNITLREVADSVSVIRNSWQTPAICDQPFTGYHLGCQTYVDTNNKSFDLKSFNRLCREEAIGCTAVIDTFNSDSPLSKTYNAGDFSQIVVPEDRVDYLVPDPGKYCQPVYQGCSALGRPERDDLTKITTVYKINDPDNYDQTLCQANAVWCEAFNSSKGEYYFKYPGQETCTYQTNVNIGGTLYSGWFKTSTIGQPLVLGCSDQPTGNPGSGVFEVADLALNANAAATCPSNKNLCTAFRDPTDPAGCDREVSVDYCSNGTDNTEAACVSNLATWIKACKNYYYYNNDNIDESSCKGQVDKNNGCVLFYESNNWNALHTDVLTKYNSTVTYQDNLAEGRPSNPVVCDSSDPLCDANRLIKVNNDRQCSEWLACKSSSAVFDPNRNGYVTVCDDLDTCVEYDKTNNITNCKKWADNTATPVPLTTEEYQLRVKDPTNHLSWSDQEYTGYSIPNSLPLADLLTIDFNSNPNIADSRLVYPIDPVTACPAVANNGNPCAVTLAGVNCTAGSAGCYTGECNDTKCAVSPLVGDISTSTFSAITRGYAENDSPFPSKIDKDATGNRYNGYEKANICEYCKSYTRNNTTGKYECSEKYVDLNCEEQYNKVTYGESGGAKYFPKGEDGGNGVCIAGDQGKVSAKLPCSFNSQCDSERLDANQQLLASTNDGVCSLKTKVETFLNWQGICAEYDLSTPLIVDKGAAYYCNQWYPTATVNGVNSLYDNYREAGYYNPDGQDLQFCAAAAPYELENDRYYCGSANSDGCFLLLKVNKGSKIFLNRIQGKEYLLNQNYLNDTASNRIVSWFDKNDPPAANPAAYPAGIGYDRIERTVPGDPGDLFVATDFVSAPNVTPSAVPQVSFDEIKEIFDGVIEKYYYDNLSKAVTPQGSMKGLRECDECGVLQCMEERGAPNFWCDPNKEHVVTVARWYDNDSCGWWGGGHDNGRVWCNPLTYHYYVKIDDDFIPVCSDTNCSPVGKGSACLFTKPTFSAYITNAIWSSGPAGYCQIDQSACSTPTCTRVTPLGTITQNCYVNPYIPTMTSESQCPRDANNVPDPNCQFNYCIYRKIIAVIPNHADIDPQNGNPMPAPGVQWCSDYGEIIKKNYYYCEGLNCRYQTTEEGDLVKFNKVYTNVEGISDCFNRLYERVEDTSVTNTNLRSLLPGGKGYKAQLKAGVNTNLATEVFGDTSAEGCLANSPDNADDFSYLANCQPPSQAFWATRNALVPGCTGQNCFQMCSTISTLDAEGNNSWVRTDIWWRSEKKTPNSKVVTPPWLSYYYWSADNRFVQDGDVLFGKIVATSTFDLPDKYFGAAKGSPGNRPVLVETPLGVTINNTLSASTFFSDAVGNADYSNLGYLFARVFNSDWDNIQSRYNPVLPDDLTNNVNESGGSAVTVAGGAINDYAGVSFNPQILRVCGNGEYCKDNNEKAIAGVTLNNLNDGPVDGKESLFVSLKFFYYAHPDHMPVRLLEVDWGDNVSVSNPGKYKNSLALCGEDTEAPTANTAMTTPGFKPVLGFGGTPEACRTGYKIFYHDYQYDPAFSCNTVPDAPPQPVPASCYRPTVTVTDWWDKPSTEVYNGWVIIKQ